ncbi:MAG TPA: sulfatase-like hydrolase/transferase, partial [Tepidisphaeraceae bacterium]|nr:sulfatase-like hydrolase/transferase [Tepidisphaeraceae bacterium]
MPRWTLLEFVLVLGVMSFVRTRAFAQPADRPNFIFMITDDQRWDELGCVQKEMGDKGRYPWFKTPNMDRLAAEGVRFRNAFVTDSLCSPSRASFLTGQYNHVNGVIDNHTPMPLDTETSGKVLGEAGYSTAYIGKFHHGKQKERPGFAYIASYLDQGYYHDCPFNVNGTMTPSHGWIDDIATDYAIQYLKDHTAGADHQKPFFMVLGFKSPHDPRTPPERDKNLFSDTVWSWPTPNFDCRPPFLPTNAKTKHATPGQHVPMDRSTIDKFRCIAAADEEVGRVLAALDDLKLAENTVIVFVGDNGYYEGEHSLWDKRTAYEESLRIPLLVRWPRLQHKGVTCDQIALNVDLAPTMLDLAGVPIPKQMQGRSWRPLLETGNDRNWRQSFFYEYFYEHPYTFAPYTLAVRT